MNKAQADVKWCIAEEKKNCEESISAVRTNVQKDLERTKLSAEQSATKSKGSAEAAKESAKLAQETQKYTRNQLDLQKEETNKIASEA
jgi:multisubunit Na+/H+ antiporter MnhE subunit